MASQFEVSNEQMRARARHDLQNKNPSPGATLAYYREQADDTDNSAAHRRQWRALADELAEHIEAQRPLSLEELQATHDPLW